MMTPEQEARFWSHGHQVRRMLEVDRIYSRRVRRLLPDLTPKARAVTRFAGGYFRATNGALELAIATPGPVLIRFTGKHLAALKQAVLKAFWMRVGGRLPNG